MEVQIINQSKAIRTLANRAGKKKVILYPGANIVSEAVAKVAQEVETQKALFDKGILRIVAAPTGDEEAKPGQMIPNLSKVKVANALEIVEACNDTHQLQEWLMQDGRAKVQSAIYARHDKLTKSEDSANDDEAK